MGGQSVACCQCRRHEHAQARGDRRCRGPLGRARPSGACAPAQGIARPRRGRRVLRRRLRHRRAAGAGRGAVGRPAHDRGEPGRLGGVRRGRLAGPAHVHRVLRRPGEGRFLLPGGRATCRPVAARRLPRVVDEHGLADRLRTQLEAPPEPPDLSDFDAHAWDWLWACAAQAAPARARVAGLPRARQVRRDDAAGRVRRACAGAVARRAADAGAPVAPRSARSSTPRCRPHPRTPSCCAR